MFSCKRGTPVLALEGYRVHRGTSLTRRLQVNADQCGRSSCKDKGNPGVRGESTLRPKCTEMTFVLARGGPVPIRFSQAPTCVSRGEGCFHPASLPRPAVQPSTLNPKALTLNPKFEHSHPYRYPLISNLEPINVNLEPPYRFTSLIKTCPPPRATIGPWA